MNLRDMTPLRRSRVAMAMLAVAGLKLGDPWGDARSYLLEPSTPTRSQREIQRFWNAHYGTGLKDSSYDNVKRHARTIWRLPTSSWLVPGTRMPR
jgi:hypothetical protein